MHGAFGPKDKLIRGVEPGLTGAHRMQLMNNPEWIIDGSIGHLVLNEPPSNRMNRFFFLN